MMVVRDYLPWLLSAITIWMTLMAGNKHPRAWLIGFGNQFLWFIWIVSVGAWGLLPMNIALWIVYARNHWKWNASPAVPPPYPTVGRPLTLRAGSLGAGPHVLFRMPLEDPTAYRDFRGGIHKCP